MIRITLVRHGETYNNRNHVVQGQDPTQGRLTEQGLLQAQLLGRALAQVPFDMVYSSPLERCCLTLSAILLARSTQRTLPLMFPDALMEINLGSLHGRPHSEWKASIRGEPMAWRAPGGESWLDVQARVTDYLRREIVPKGHREILVVAHGGVNRGILASLTGLPMAQCWDGPGVGTPQENSCVNVLELSPQGDLLSALVNDTRHLSPAFPDAGPGQRWVPAERRWQLLEPGHAHGSLEFIPVA